MIPPSAGQVRNKKARKSHRSKVAKALDVLLLKLDERECKALGQIEDPVEHPSHYNFHPSGVECIEIVEHFGFNIGNAVKYCWRAGLKNPDPKEDLAKAIWYIKRELERLEKAGGK